MSLSLDQILATAKAQMLTEGHLPPVVVVAVGSKPYWLPITDGWNDDHDGRVKALFLLGREFAQGAGVTPEKISAVFLVSEVWAVDRQPGEPMEGSVEEQPDRRECLSVLEMRTEGKALKHTWYLSEILRQGGVVDLGPAQQRDQVETALLASFLAGVGTVRMSNRQLLQLMQNVQDLGGK